ncbi:MAG TPA: GNVR domain-containing protein [Gemmatimonadaceae bacterium]|nr:GNVR domain-containing protein [Gemmatimonadaceae bacterium]
MRPEDVLLIARRWKQILLPFLIISLATAVYVGRLPDRFRAETLIMIVPQRVPENYVRSTVSTRIQDRLQSINQQIMSRSRLEPVIREFNLYPGLVQAGLMEDVIERMRRDAVAQVVRGDAFRISYTAGDPRTAMKVTERLASLYIDENLRDREVLADGTNQFLESQLAAAKERLIEHEKKLEEYNRRYSGQLPTNVGANLQVLQNSQLQIQALVDSISRDKDRQMVLEGILADANAGSASEVAAAGGTAGAPPSTPVPMLRSAAELDAANKVLQEMQLRLKPEHPDVMRQKRTIAELQKKADDEAAIAGLMPQAKVPVVTDRVELARLNRIGQARSELDTLGPQIAKKEQEEARLRGVVAAYQSRVEAAPTRESELIELTRDYGTLQATYQSLLRKKEDAQLSANLERYQIGEQFKVLDPARMPEKPFSPDRPRLYALGAVSGLGIGLALAVFLEFRDTTLKTETDVVMAIGLPVLALIPELVTDEEKTVRRRRKLLTSFAAAGAAATLAGVLLWVFRWPSGLW